MHSTGSMFSRRTRSARPRYSGGTPSVAEMKWLGTMSRVSPNQSTERPVSTRPLSGIGVGWVTS